MKLLAVCVLAILHGAISIPRQKRDDCQQKQDNYQACVASAHAEHGHALAQQDDGKPHFYSRKSCNYIEKAVKGCGDLLVGDCFSAEWVQDMKNNQFKAIVEQLEKAEEWDSDKCPSVKEWKDGLAEGEADDNNDGADGEAAGDAEEKTEGEDTDGDNDGDNADGDNDGDDTDGDNGGGDDDNDGDEDENDGDDTNEDGDGAVVENGDGDGDGDGNGDGDGGSEGEGAEDGSGDGGDGGDDSGSAALNVGVATLVGAIALAFNH